MDDLDAIIQSYKTKFSKRSTKPLSEQDITDLEDLITKSYSISHNRNSHAHLFPYFNEVRKRILSLYIYNLIISKKLDTILSLTFLHRWDKKQLTRIYQNYHKKKLKTLLLLCNQILQHKIPILIFFIPLSLIFGTLLINLVTLPSLCFLFYSAYRFLLWHEEKETHLITKISTIICPT